MAAITAMLALSVWANPRAGVAFEPVDSLAVGRLWFHAGGDSIALSYASTHDLSMQHPGITRAIINIHGSNRESEIAMANVLTAGNQHDRDVWDHTAVICPQFLFKMDLESRIMTDTLFYWHSIEDIGPSWCYGDESDDHNDHPRPFTRSSYACLDTLATLVLQAFPNLENLVFAGHSAGARFMQRHAIVTRWDIGISSPRILFNYANPAVYAYIGPERPAGDNWNEFAVPPDSEIAQCPEYDDWPFGLQQLNEYFSDQSVGQIRERYAGRHVIQWLSELDTVGFDGGSQVSCMAMMSGDLYRLQRGLIYYNHVQFTYGGEPEKFVQAIIPNLGHVGNAVYRSPVGRYFLFDYYDPVAADEEFALGGDLTVPVAETVDGIIVFSAGVQNLTQETRTGELWAQLVSWDGESCGGWIRPVVYEPGMDTTLVDQEFSVPEGFPYGDATLHLFVGNYPEVIAAADEESVEVTSTTDVSESARNPLPGKPGIVSLAPNPFNGWATLAIATPSPARLRIQVYDVLGREVMTVVNGPVSRGMHVYALPADHLAGGIYFLRATAPGGYEEVRKIVLVP